MRSSFVVSACIFCCTVFPCSNDSTLKWLKVRTHLTFTCVFHVSSRCVFLCLTRLLHSLLLLPHFLSDHPFFLKPDNFNFHDVVDKTNTLRTSAEDLGTLAENEPPTSYEPNAHCITEAHVDYTQESSGEQRPPNDFNYDDVTIGKMLSDACRRRADHYEEGLSSSLSSSVRHDRTGRPVVCRLVSSARETQRHNSEKRTD